MNLKAGISTSLFLHILVAVAGLYSAIEITKEQQGNIPVEIQYSGEGYEKIDVIEITEGPGEELKKNYFYGIGVGLNPIFNIEYNKKLWIITDVYSGYSAESSGIKVGDVILKVNGEDYSDLNDIKGSSPGRINLTIIRNNVIIVIQLERVKVYY